MHEDYTTVADGVYACTNSLRWFQTQAASGEVERVLQQAWRCLRTGDVKWHNVPVVEER